MGTRTSKQSKNFFRRIIDGLDGIHVGVGKERDFFVENLSMLVSSGMGMTSAIDAISVEIRSRSMKKILAKIKEDIINGSPLWRALQGSKIFHGYTISLVRIGEETGRLSENLLLIARQEEKDRSFRSKLRSAMLYPILVLSLTVVIGIGIAWFILPRLASIFAQLDIELPLLTRYLIRAGEFMGEHGKIAFPAFIVGLILLLFFVFKFSKTKFIGQALLFSFPGVNRLLKEVELARFGYLLGTLLRAGIPVTAALDSLHEATVFRRYRKLYAHLRESIDAGNSFQKSFADYRKVNKLIPAPIQQLIIAGEQSGKLSDILIAISERFEAKTEDTTKNLTVILEPILLIIVWLGVVAVALAVILPIYNLVGGLNNSTSDTTSEQSVEEVVESLPVIDDTASSTIPIEEEIVLPTLEIISTDIEFLNVRDEASTEGDIIAEVFPGETFEYLDEEEGWFEIVLTDDETGWVFGEYVIPESTTEE